MLPDGLWKIVQPLLPPPPKTGRPRADQRAVLTTVLFVQASGCSWEKADGLFGVTARPATGRCSGPGDSVRVGEWSKSPLGHERRPCSAGPFLLPGPWGRPGAGTPAPAVEGPAAPGPGGAAGADVPSPYPAPAETPQTPGRKRFASGEGAPWCAASPPSGGEALVLLLERGQGPVDLVGEPGGRRPGGRHLERNEL
ncbi:transposase [Nocardiopsis halotolerans]|uniref:transposase n=1 Tax=Nocardiopsis halotolerans TaxID=124252 RepID=UPI00373AE5FB